MHVFARLREIASSLRVALGAVVTTGTCRSCMPNMGSCGCRVGIALRVETQERHVPQPSNSERCLGSDLWFSGKSDDR